VPELTENLALREGAPKAPERAFWGGDKYYRFFGMRVLWAEMRNPNYLDSPLKIEMIWSWNWPLLEMMVPV